MPRRLARFSCLSAALLGLAGCVSYGPRMMLPARADYAQSLARSSAEQLLLNLVRLRYRNNPAFLEIGTVVTHYSRAAGAGVGGKLVEGGAGELSASGAFSFGEDPTITYTPLQGEEFVKRLLTPLDPSVVVYLSQSGWSLERLMLCCVQKVNGLRNAISASGPTPDLAPEFSDFRAAARDLRALQVAGLLDLESNDGKSMQLHVRTPPTEELLRARDELIRLLDLDPQTAVFRIAPALNRQQRDEVAVTGRSLLGTMYFLSQAVEPPAEDETAGRVTVTRRGDGSRFDWREVLGSLIAIHSSHEEPQGAAVRVSYRGSWFFIADADLNSKSTFNLLSLLYSLKSGAGDLRGPLLTLGVP